MFKKIALFVLPLGLFATTAQAICVNNETDSKLYYEIRNQNISCPLPKVKFHSGIVESKQKQCHAHTPGEGSDWKIYRFDSIKIFKINEQGEHEPVCNKAVNGILNTLNISYFPWTNHWSCLDREDDRDLR